MTNQTVEFQGRVFPVTTSDDGMLTVRYKHLGRTDRQCRPIVGSVSARDITRLPGLLLVQSKAMNDSQMEPR